MTIHRKPFQYTLLGLVVLLTTAGCFFGIVRVFFSEVNAKDTTPAEANRVFGENLCILTVPEQASRVDIHARFETGGASFDIEEEHFLDWARDHDWSITRVQPSSDPQWITPVCRPEWPSSTKDAWYFSNASHRGGWDVMYDRDLCRAYVFFAPR